MYPWPSANCREPCGTATAVSRIAGYAETNAGACVTAPILNLRAKRQLASGGCDVDD
jgi:hypothetical protein